MTLRKMVLSLLSHTHLLKDKHQPFQHNFRDSVEDLRAWSREIEKHDGLHAQYTWIRDHKDELQEGKKLVQREMHISAQLLHLQTMADQESSPNPSHQEQILQYEAELKQTNRECLKHQALLADLESYKPPGRLAGEHLILYGQHANPEAWKAEQEKCRLRGGCCIVLEGCGTSIVLGVVPVVSGIKERVVFLQHWPQFRSFDSSPATEF
ncbi:uncharacterized protein N7496_000033 [Penicillium cataractarum]|uniref:Uncharacterized protein n=1 Tax=Penicillium cataractarum TaxID=2100454 RepID=A0A9W9VTL5_9EURO|nr:uncharacterized protein N7496_000033 [Penicillium cataractarum]KAJ5388965.1 hypothetical protein N7496_000033 [Penicillium cataractarum]